MASDPLANTPVGVKPGRVDVSRATLWFAEYSARDNVGTQAPR
jgi:hypothetical protein